MIPTEDNYVDWILNGIREYFRRIDYRVRTYSIGQIKERHCPVDRILAVGNKIIGLQFKRPMSKQRPWRYKPVKHQHEMVSHAHWIFYCLPDFIDFHLQEVALYHCKFVAGDDYKFDSGINGPYYRWGAFAEALIGCWEGFEVSEGTSIESLITDIISNPHDTYLTMNKSFEEIYIIRNISSPITMEHEPA